jgi:hypothetical protein
LKKVKSTDKENVVADKQFESNSNSGAAVEHWIANQKDIGSNPSNAAFDLFVGKLTENCRKTSLHEHKNRRKVPLRFEMFHLRRRNLSD